ncbi:MAG TPA: hypothetical protein DHV36_08835 [Desulfobacteraceae bacterium]|nr:hypothetical protein [Desulfobacteraceae bacterium]|tara:strand:+ start:398 stop:805 length:408 start_codon:yes stop_codon:yes gene_type:complete
MVEMILTYQTMLMWISGISLAFFLFSLAAVPWMVARIPVSYFRDLAIDEKGNSGAGRHPVIRILKNLTGVCLLVMGIIMLFIPGQGLLTMLVGLLLLDFPGKTAGVIFLVRKKAVQSSLNWVRSKKGAAPLKFPD